MGKFAALLIIVILTGVLVSDTKLEIARAFEGVTGIIALNSTWTKANSPYNLTGNVAIEKEVTLTIEPGVIVNLNGHYIRVNGTLVARGTSSERIQFNRGLIEFRESSSVWNEQFGSGNIIEGAIVNSRISMEGASPKINKNTISESISVGGGSPIISKNAITSTISSDQYGRPIYSETAIFISNENTALVIDNTIIVNVDEAAIMIGRGSPTIQRNRISNAYGYGSSEDFHQAGVSIFEKASPIIRENTITKNAIGISLGGSPIPTIVENNIEDNTRYNLYMGSRIVNVDVANNWWGNTNTSEIDRKIWDFNDNFDLGKVNYTPFLTEPNPQAMPDQNAPLPTPQPSSSPSTSPSASPTSTPSGFDWANIAVPLVAVVVVVAVVAAVFLRKKRIKQSQPAS